MSSPASSRNLQGGSCQHAALILRPASPRRLQKAAGWWVCGSCLVAVATLRSHKSWATSTHWMGGGSWLVAEWSLRRSQHAACMQEVMERMLRCHLQLARR